MPMSEISIRAARPADRPGVLSLLDASALPSDGVDPALAGFLVAEEGDAIVGVAGLERYGEDGLLRSVAVAPARRGAGLGARLTGAVVAEARSLGLAGVYALTTTAERYFPRLGFEVIERSELPWTVRSSGEFRTVCPDSAVALRLRLIDR
jgi:amino-acid N-acetyltransferase